MARRSSNGNASQVSAAASYRLRLF